MKRYRFAIILIAALSAVLWVLLPAGNARADAASIVGGGGGTVRLMDNETIQLKSEYIRVQVHLDRAEFLIVYDFVNTTGKAQTVRLGFPERAAFYEEEKLNDFKVMDSDEPVPTALEPGQPEVGRVDGVDVPAMNYYTFQLTFAPGEAKRVTNAYWVWSTEYKGLYSLVYYLHTGATWKGPIESVDVLVTFDPELVMPGPTLKALELDTTPAGYELDTGSGQLSWRFTDLEPTPADDLQILYLHAGRPFDLELTASSELAPSRDPDGPSFYPFWLMDDDPATAWAEGVAGPGLGQWVQATFLEPGGYEVHRLGILPGYAKGDLFAANNRVKAATLHFSDGSSKKIELEDRPCMQFFEIEPIQTTYVKLVVDAVYPGSLFDDTCISEMEIYTNN